MSVRKSYICDMPAHLLKRNAKLSRGARMLYATMRALANGKTGELAIRGNPLDWHYIARQAELCRRTRHKYLGELLEAGYVHCERERVTIWKNGRKRVVLGRARYFVYRQPKTLKKPRILQRGKSCMVQEMLPQISSETPYTSEARLEFDTKGLGFGDTRDKSTSPARDDGFSHSDISSSKAKEAENPFLIEEDARVIHAVRKNIARAYKPVHYQLNLAEVSDEWFLVAMEHIEARGTAKIGSPVPYFTKALATFLANVLTEEESDRELLELINEEVARRHALRKKYMADLNPILTPEQERARQQFNTIMGGKATA